ncbi:MAG: DUF3179 domain-containing protein [Halopseudomonas sp.]
MPTKTQNRASFFGLLGRAAWLGLLLISNLALAQSYNGFDLEGSLLPPEKILQGGPPRDGIPSIDRPKFIQADQNHLLKPDSLVVGINVGGESRAYPIAILNWHELVNDRIGSQSLVISYCPLCGTALVFNAEVEGQTLEFGVSGLLYNSDLLLYDRNNQSLWSQITGEAISGPLKGQRLELLSSMLTSWQRWRTEHPQTLLLSTETGFVRDYHRSPYGDYDNSERLYFPVEFLSRRYHPKERVLGVEVDGVFKAYPFAELAKRTDQDPIYDSLAGKSLRIEYDLPSRSGRVFDEAGDELPLINSFWFAWYGFHPQTEVFEFKP